MKFKLKSALIANLKSLAFIWLVVNICDDEDHCFTRGIYHAENGFVDFNFGVHALQLL